MKEKYNTYKNPFCWTEDNRLQAVKDDKMGAFYNYDASGERNLKLSGGTMDVTQNGYTMNVPVLDEQTLYASALVTINDKGYTKHYFEEGKRICSKIGSGGFNDLDILVEQMEMDYNWQFAVQKDGLHKAFDECFGVSPEIKTKDIFEVIKPYSGQVNPDEPVFYYHSDHLGSASYITDDHGNETQHLVYLPFGEDWVDMKYNTSQFDTPYKFNGKEKDPETGLHYYGARYLNTDLSIWLSVDPMSDKYPHLTSYNYCANNPVMLVDPDGRDVEPTTPEAAEQIKKYTSEQINGKKNKDYQPEFAALYKDWEENELINVKFTTVTEEGIGGTVDYTYQPDKKAKDEYTISWNPNITDKLGTSALFEEAAHLDDGLKGGYGIKNGNKGFGINNEIKAKDWTINNIKNITPTYMEGGLLKQTHYGYFKKNPSKLNGNSLGNGVSLHATPGMKSYILYGTGGKGYKTMLENEKMKK